MCLRLFFIRTSIIGWRVEGGGCGSLFPDACLLSRVRRVRLSWPGGRQVAEGHCAQGWSADANLERPDFGADLSVGGVSAQVFQIRIFGKPPEIAVA